MKYWSVKDGALVGSTLPDGINFNTFLCSKKKYKDFELQFQVKLHGKGWSGNSGVQIRSKIIDTETQETLRRYRPAMRHGRGLLGQPLRRSLRRHDEAGADGPRQEGAVKEDDFNDYYIKCVGKHVTIKLNGETTVDDDFAKMPDEGIIAWQLHGGKPMEVTFQEHRVQGFEQEVIMEV